MPSELTPQNTIFVNMSFEGPDQYSQAGGLGVRVAGLDAALAAHGFATHLLFIGDPQLPSQEVREEGRLTLHRWRHTFTEGPQRGCPGSHSSGGHW